MWFCEKSWTRFTDNSLVDDHAECIKLHSKPNTTLIWKGALVLNTLIRHTPQYTFVLKWLQIWVRLEPTYKLEKMKWLPFFNVDFYVYVYIYTLVIKLVDTIMRTWTYSVVTKVCHQLPLHWFHLGANRERCNQPHERRWKAHLLLQNKYMPYASYNIL